VRTQRDGHPEAAGVLFDGDVLAAMTVKGRRWFVDRLS
jgi:hypothetical protein